MFGKLKSEGLEESTDRLGGGGFILETDAYRLRIKLAYGLVSQGGAQGVAFVFDQLDADGEPLGKEYKETLYVTNRNGDNFFLNKQDKSKKVPLPGFTVVDDICLIVSDKPLCDQTIEEKIQSIWNPEKKAEEPTAVPVLTDLLGGEVVLGIQKSLVNKNQKNDATGQYEPTAETRDENNIEKVFHPENLITVAEARAGREPAFHDAWVERNKGQTRDKRTIKDGQGGSAGRPGASGPPKAGAGNGGTPARSLFGKK